MIGGRGNVDGACFAVDLVAWERSFRGFSEGTRAEVSVI